MGKLCGVFALMSWLGLAAWFSLTFMALVLVRVTTPRLRLESLSRLGWVALLGQLAVVALAYLLVFSLV